MSESTREPMDQYECTETVLSTFPDAAIVSNLGVASWILATLEDRHRNFYMDGAMGGTSATGLGIALGTDADVVVLEGDGSLLMSLGVLSMIGEYGPANLTVVLMDNGTYQTTGGQPSITTAVDFAAVAEDCGVQSYRTRSDAEFESALRTASEHDGPTLVECPVEPVDVGPPEDFVNYERSHAYLAHRFRRALEER